MPFRKKEQSVEVTMPVADVEAMIDRLNTTIERLQNATHDLSQETQKAARVAADLKRAMDKGEALARRTIPKR